MHKLLEGRPQEYLSLPILPLKNMAILPGSIIPVIVGRKASIEAVEVALKSDRNLFVTLQKNTQIEIPGVQDVYATGTRSTILQVMRMAKGGLKILIEGVTRCILKEEIDASGYIRASCADQETSGMEFDIELEAAWRAARSWYQNYRELNPKIPADLMLAHATPAEMEQIVDTIFVHIATSITDRQTFLEIEILKERIFRLCGTLEKEISILKAEDRIRGRVQDQIGKNQQEYYWTEQIKAIYKELGREDHHEDIAILQTKIKNFKAPQDIIDKLEREVRRLEQMPPASAEGATVRHYIEWILALPWQKASQDSISLPAAQKILDRRHAGLQKAKERIIEYIAARKFAKNLKRSPIICLAGPPGVGKTSLAESIAESLGREFRRISLGGVRDEAEIRGHRRTYIGALPGKIIQAMRQGKTINPVILLDEIDKLAMDAHGDPASALLEVLDPEQNKTFVDHFIELPYDLSQVVFIATANHLENIPLPLHDRMEIISLAGYTEDEKLEIARKFLIPKNFKEHALTTQQCKIPLPTLRLIISEYTKEAGVRQLERSLTKIIRKTIQGLLNDTKQTPITVTTALIHEWLGYPKFKIKPIDHNIERIGLVSGLAWTEFGGDILEIETSIVAGKGNMTLTGQLGDVMQESAYAALTYIRSRAPQLGLKSSFSTTKDIHIHIPEGATPKDGPSAGISMCTALVSELTKSPVDPSVAMTGEITLRGRVLPVGGLKEKLLAARQHGIKKVILPQENKAEVDEIKAELGSDIALKFVDTMDEVLDQALLKSPFIKPLKTGKRTEESSVRA
jgi:ATP-dependent Lon protease